MGKECCCKMCKWIGRNFYKLAVLVLIVIVGAFSKTVISKATELNEQLFYEKVKTSQSTGEYSDVLEAEIKNTTSCRTVKVQKPETKTVKRSNSSRDEQTKKVFLYHLLCIVYICALGVTITALLIIILKDDSGIRYKKLDELHEIKEKLLLGDFTNIRDETKKEERHSKTTSVVGQESNTETKTTSTETTDDRVKLLKHYMSCVADI